MISRKGATTDLYLEMNAREGAYPDLAILKMSAREGGATAVGLRGILKMSGRVPDLGLPVMPDLDLERVTKGRRSVEVHSLGSGVLRECKSSSRRAMSVFLYGEISQSVVYAELTCWT